MARRRSQLCWPNAQSRRPMGPAAIVMDSDTDQNANIKTTDTPTGAPRSFIMTALPLISASVESPKLLELRGEWATCLDIA